MRWAGPALWARLHGLLCVPAEADCGGSAEAAAEAIVQLRKHNEANLTLSVPMRLLVLRAASRHTSPHDAACRLLRSSVPRQKRAEGSHLRRLRARLATVRVGGAVDGL